MLSLPELIKRAYSRSEEPDDYWDQATKMLSKKKSLELGQFTQKEWNWYQQIKAELTEAWE